MNSFRRNLVSIKAETGFDSNSGTVKQAGIVLPYQYTDELNAADLIDLWILLWWVPVSDEIVLFLSSGRLSQVYWWSPLCNLVEDNENYGGLWTIYDKGKSQV